MRQKKVKLAEGEPLFGSEALLDARGHKVGRVVRFGRRVWITGPAGDYDGESTCVCGRVVCDAGCLCDCEVPCE